MLLAYETMCLMLGLREKKISSGKEEKISDANCINLLNPAGYVMHQQFNIQQLYALPTLYLCFLYLSEDKQRLVPRTS